MTRLERGDKSTSVSSDNVSVEAEHSERDGPLPSTSDAKIKSRVLKPSTVTFVCYL